MHVFKAQVELIGINPYVLVPEVILLSIFTDAGKVKGNIPVAGTINGKTYKQTLVRYSGDWRLYINTSMLKNSPKRIGELIEIGIRFDSDDRNESVHPQLQIAFKQFPEAQTVFERLTPSLQKEICRYINRLKSNESRDRNIEKAIGFLLGQNRFIGRDHPEK